MNKSIDNNCNLKFYFERPPDSIIVDISLLILDHTPLPEKIEKAKDFMERAKKGEYPKREPISIQKLPDGKYKVLNGNTTTTILKSLGCKEIVAMVLTK